MARPVHVNDMDISQKMNRGGYSVQIAFMGVWPDAIGVSGAVLVLASVVGIALEERYIGNRSHDEYDDAAEEEEQRSSRAG